MNAHNDVKFVLGLDISSVSTGWCVFFENSLLDYGKILLSNNIDLFERLTLFRLELESILRRYSIDVAVIEDGFFKSNLKTTKVLSYFSGVAIQLLESHDIFIELIPVQTIRRFFGSKVTKEKVFELVCSLFGFNFSFKDENDVTDAIAVALTFFGRMENKTWDELRRKISIV